MQLKEILKKNNFRFNKRFGQNFITDENLLNKIVELSGVNNDDTVIEIGAGGGTLTSALCKKAKKVIAYEVDNNLQPILAETLSEYDNARVIFKDVMKVKTEEIEREVGGKYKVVANLPYYITTPILMKFIEEGKNLASISVTVQEEVADRLCAKEGTGDYGSITASIDAVGTAKKVLKIGRNNFYPVPNVDSALVRIDIDRNKYDIKDSEKFKAVVRCAFSSRRKTFVNNLMQSFNMDREEAEKLVKSIGKDVLVRGETLSTEDFIRVSEFIK